MNPSALRRDAAVAVGDTSAAAVAWRFRGAVQVTAIAKATFSFAPDAPMTRITAQPLLRAELHHGNKPTRSVRLTTDLAPYLNRADVLFTGHAHAPRGVVVETMPVRLAVLDGSQPLLDKTLIVRQRGGVKQVPLVYEGAYGGADFADNPVGVGASPGGEPSVLDPANDKRPIGFGPIGEGWPARARHLGSFDPTTLQAHGIADLPDDLDWSYFQAAPEDQRVGFLRGDEWIVLEGLHPQHARIRASLPGAHGIARVYGLGPWGIAEGQILPLQADTLRIDGDEEHCTLTFRAAFPVPDLAALPHVRVVVGVALPGHPIRWPDRADPDIEDIPLSSQDLVDVPIAVLERTALAGEEAGGSGSSPPPPDSSPMLHTIASESGAYARPALPFAGTGPAAPRDWVDRTVEIHDGTVTSGAQVDRSAAKAPQPVSNWKQRTIAIEAGAEVRPALPFAGAATPTPAPPRGAPMTATAFEEQQGFELPPAAPSPPAAHVATARATRPPIADDGRTVRIVHKTPFEVAVVPARIGAPAVRITVAATCDLAEHGPAVLRPRADPPTEDLADGRARADVTLTGHAHAPSRGARQGEVTFCFGHDGNAFERRIAVFGDRRWRRGRKGLPVITEPEPFERIPLDLEHAYGGPGFAPNLEGRGHDLPIRACDGAPLPNLEDAENLIRTLAHEQAPACPAPLPVALRRGGQTAPEAQQLEPLSGDEPFTIAGVRPDGATIEGTLPGVRARCFARLQGAAGGAVAEVPLRLDAAAFDADERTLRFVFRGLLAVADEAAPGRSVTALLVTSETVGGEPVTLEQARSLLEGA